MWTAVSTPCGLQLPLSLSPPSQPPSQGGADLRVLLRSSEGEDQVGPARTRHRVPWAPLNTVVSQNRGPALGDMLVAKVPFLGDVKLASLSNT